MTTNMKSAVAAFFSAATSVALAWVAGFDFDRRGLDVCMWVSVALWVTLMSAVVVRVQ